MYIPEFQFNKDSYILKHKLDYNTKCNGEWSGITYGILFTDYDLARKTQSKNAEKFSEIEIDYDVNDIFGINITHYDIDYNLILFGRWFYTEFILSGNTFSESGATFVTSNENQKYYVPSGSTSLFTEGDLFNVYFHIIELISGTTEWSHFGPAGETWVATGTTANGIPFQVTGTTTVNGYSSGTTTYEVLDYTPILKYSAKAVEIGTDFIALERKLEDYIYNNIMKIAKDYDYESVAYTIESLHFSDDSYYGVKYILEETFWSDYFTISATNNNLIFNPTPNKKDLYFDYDNLTVEVFSSSGATYKNFETNCLYVKYKLDDFLYQFGFDSGTTINFDEVCFVDNDTPTYGGESYFNIILNDIDDADYFTPYTYIYANSSGSTHICLITNIENNVITLLMPRTSFANGEQILNIQNLHTVNDISKMLYEVFINIEGELEDPGVFYLGDFFDPTIIGLNVIDPNLFGPWVFDPS